MHPDGLAAQALRHFDVVDAVTAGVGCVEVLERERDLVVHLEAPLCLPDQSKVGVVDDDVEIGELELCPHGQRSSIMNWKS
jgi:hypothetical protein